MKTPREFEERFSFFPYGTQYHRAPTPRPSEWAGDLRELAAKGYTHIQFRPQWRWHERIRGAATWDDLDCLFDLAAKHKLRVVLKPMLETAPDWVFEELDGSRIGFHGVPISPFAHGACYVGGWWPCFDNPAVVAAASDFVRQMIRRYKDHAALWFYDAWNEPVSRPLGQCQCRHSAASYSAWLRRKYGTIENLNAAFGKAWTSFETVRPASAAADYVDMFLWRKWAGFAVAEQVRFVAEAIRDVHPQAHIMVHVGGSLIVQDPACGASDDFQNRQWTDRYGTSFWLMLHPQTPVQHARAELQSSWLRRVDARYWCHELYPNHAEWCEPPDPVTLRRMIWSAVAGGAAGFTFWQYRSERVGNETNGFGLRNIDGTPTPRSKVADAIAAKLKKHGQALVGARRVPSGVALLYSHDSDLIGRIQAMPGGIDSIAEERGREDYPYKRGIAAMHAMCHYLGVEPDWVVPGDDLTKIKLLVVTGAEMIDAATARWLTAFVRKGGKLVVEFPFACRDQNTWVSPARPSCGLEVLLGCAEQDRVVAKSLDRFAIEGVGADLPAGAWRIKLAPRKGAAVIGRWANGEAAAVRHRAGQGEVVALGGSLALGFGDRWDDPVAATLGALLASLGVKLPAWSGTGVVVNRRRGPAGDIWFVLNYAQEKRQVELPMIPSQAIEATGVAVRDRSLVLGPGAVWVGTAESR
jgi:beta-galactosidase GanA